MLRPLIASSVLGATVGSVLAAGVLFARAEATPGTVFIDNFIFNPKAVTVKDNVWRDQDALTAR